MMHVSLLSLQPLVGCLSLLLHALRARMPGQTSPEAQPMAQPDACLGSCRPDAQPMAQPMGRRPQGPNNRAIRARHQGQP
eukprot:3812544-Pyramimonas_sp.AAC.1